MRAYRNIELRRHQNNGEILIYVRKTAAINLANINCVGLHELLKHHAICAGPAQSSVTRTAEIFEQIKFLLGHSSIQTTERYLGSERDLAVAVNDNLGL
jgi:hypothetical protein